MKNIINERCLKSPNLHLQEYIDDIPTAMKSADIFLGRAGASTVSELIATCTPSILVPSPNVTADHQTKNALSLQKHAKIEVLREADLTGDLLSDTVYEYALSQEKQNDMRASLSAIRAQDITQQIQQMIIEIRK
jgi:UDP-N-acetylglucosamine--N-acetylmuramyl-(pentapeptide) pyrophosphoryl-undecaprenol N-acetylglucosamine transferase